MRPHRVRLTHSLVENYGLSKRLSVHRPSRCTSMDLELFHADGTCLRMIHPHARCRRGAFVGGPC
jgi:hypothetical protein